MHHRRSRLSRAEHLPCSVAEVGAASTIAAAGATHRASTSHVAHAFSAPQRAGTGR